MNESSAATACRTSGRASAATGAAASPSRAARRTRVAPATMSHDGAHDVAGVDGARHDLALRPAARTAIHPAARVDGGGAAPHLVEGLIEEVAHDLGVEL